MATVTGRVTVGDRVLTPSADLTLPPPVQTTSAPGWQATASNTGLAKLGYTAADLAALPQYQGGLTINGRVYRQRFGSASNPITGVINLGALGVLEECAIYTTAHRAITFTGTGATLLNVDLVNLSRSTGEVIGMYSASSGVKITNLKQTGATIFAWLDGDNPSTIDGWYASGQIAGGSAHHDGFTRRVGKGPIRIRNARIACTQGGTTGAFFLQPTWGAVGNVTLEDSYLEGNGYCATIESCDRLTVVNNRFRPTEYGAVTKSGSVSGLVWSENFLYSATATDCKGTRVQAP